MRKLLTTTIKIIVGVELAYLVLVNVFLNTGLGPDLVNLKPEKFRLQWSGGWSIVPGLINAKEIKLRTQTSRAQWYLEVDEGSLWLRWWKLPFKNFEASGIEAKGLSFFLRHRLPPDAKPQGALVTPDIPGLTNPPQTSPEQLYPTAGKPWRIALTNLNAKQIKEIWVQQFRITGQGEAQVGLYSVITQGGPTTLSESTFEFTQAKFELEKEVFGTNLQIQAKTNLDPLVLRDSTFKQVAAHISGTVSIAGLVNNLDALNVIHQGLPIHIESKGQIDLTASLKLDHGKLLPDSTLLANARRLVVKYLHYTVKGQGSLRGEVTEATGHALTTLRLVFDEFTLADEDNEPYLKDRGFELVTTVHDTGLANSGQDLKVVATLPESFIPDLTHYNEYIPSGVGLKILQGTGRLLSQFEFTKDEEKVAGEIKLALTDIVANYRSVTVSGHADLHTVIKRGELDSKRFDAAGTRLDLSDITVIKDQRKIASDWWGKVTFGNTALGFKPKPAVTGDIEIRMSDTKPILAIFQEQEDLPDWIKQELVLEDLTAEAVLTLSNRVLNIEDFELNSGDWTMLGDLVMKPGAREGILYIKHGQLGFAIERIGDHRKVKLLHGQEWFDERRAQFRANNKYGSGE